MNVWILLLVFATTGCATTGCATSTIDGKTFAEATKSLAETGQATLPDGGVVRAIDGPRVYVDTLVDCSFGEVFWVECDDDLDVPWSSVSLIDDKLVIDVPSAFLLNNARKATFDVTEIDEVGVFYDGRDEDWRPTWGVGVMAFGPSAFFAFHFHVFPFEWWAIDAGIFGAPHVGTGFVGTRIRPFNFDGWMPFVGVAANGILSGGVSEEELEAPVDDTPVTRIGPRLGVDFEFSKRRGLLGLEINLFYTQGPKDGFALNKIDAWSPYGGAYIAYLF